MPTTYGVIERNGINFSHDSAISISYNNQSSGLTATEVQSAIDELKSSIPTDLDQLNDDATHRLVTDTEKNTWNNKQNKLTQGSNITISGNTISATDHIYNTVTTASEGLCPALDGGTSKYLRADGTWKVPTGTTYATVTSSGEGLCPTLPNNTSRFLRGDGTWQVPSGGAVTGVKGANQSTYSTGNVNLTPKNIGSLISNSLNQSTLTLDQFVHLIEDGGNGLCWSGNIYIPSDIGFGITDWVRVIMYGQNSPDNGTYDVNISVFIFANDGWPRYYYITGKNDGAYTIKYYGRIQGLTESSVSEATFKVETASGGNICTVGGNSINKWLYLQGNTLVSGQQALWIGASGEDHYRTFLGVRDETWMYGPAYDNELYLGLSDYRWRALYAVNGTIQTSDRNQKEEIEDLDEQAKDFIMSLKPVSYKYKNDANSNHDRTHYGLISQDVEEAMASFGMSAMDFGGFCKDQKTEEYEEEVIDEYGAPTTVTKCRPVNGEYVYGLRYEEFIAPLIKTVQLQEERINQLEAQLQALQTS